MFDVKRLKKYNIPCHIKMQIFLSANMFMLIIIFEKIMQKQNALTGHGYMLYEINSNLMSLDIRI